MASQRMLSPKAMGVLMSVLVMIPGLTLVVTQQRTEKRCGSFLELNRQVNRWQRKRQPYSIDVTLRGKDGSTTELTNEVFGRIHTTRMIVTAADTTREVLWTIADGPDTKTYKSTEASDDWPAQWTLDASGQIPDYFLTSDFGLATLISQCQKRNGYLLKGGIQFDTPVLGGAVDFMRIVAIVDPKRTLAAKEHLAALQVCDSGGTQCRTAQVTV
jgi:hypothetical protein